MINRPKGTQDVLPSESGKWQAVEAAAREVARRFNLHEIRTPVFEHTELFLRGVGETTDIVGKEMYTFNDKGNRSITLKPEGTAGVVRSFIENGLFNLPMPLKTYYFTPVFRYERPQSGRLREHHQFGVEVFGSALPETDAEIMHAAHMFFSGLGVPGLCANINSIGCPECRPKYNAALRAYYSDNAEKLCAQCTDRLEKNPLRLLDCKQESCQPLRDNAPRTLDHLCNECAEHFEGVKHGLDCCGVPYNVDSSIVRGLDYYTRTVFEFISDSLGAKSTVCGGGRYDNLVQSLGGKPTPAAGFGLGFERLLIMLERLGKQPDANTYTDIYIAPLGQAERAAALRLVSQLRGAGLSAETDLAGRALKAQLKYAEKLGAAYSAVIGGDELESGSLSLKNMHTGESVKLAFNDIGGYILGAKKT